MAPMPKYKPERVLVVDDSQDTLEVVRRNLTAAGFQVAVVPGVAEAVRALSSAPVDLVITDLRMPKISGMDLVRYVRENFADIEI